MSTGKVIRHTNCPKCGSQDNLAVYDDGHHYCFTPGCGYDKGERTDVTTSNEAPPAEEFKPVTHGLPATDQPAWKDRGLLAATIERYKVTTLVQDDDTIEAVFPLTDPDGNHIGNQIRFADKKFKAEGHIGKRALFGQSIFPAGGKALTITEGYPDAMAAFQLTGSRYAFTGVMSASTAKKEIVDNFEYVNSFEKIVLNFDNDEQGVKAARECASLFEPGKVFVLTLGRAKDANDYLLKGLTREYVDEWFRAPVFMLEGLVLGSDPAFVQEVVDYEEPRAIPYPWDSLNKKLYGQRKSEMTLILADTGVGKTSFVKEIEHSLIVNPDLIAEEEGIGILHLEETRRQFALGIMSIHNNKPYHFPDVARTKEELHEAFSATLNNDRVVIWDHFGSNDIDVVLAKIRHMAALGCGTVVVDHLSIVVSDQREDERKQLDEISTKLKMLTMELDIHAICIIHTNRQGQVRGSAGPEQVANTILRLERDITSPDDWRRNILKVTVLKNRAHGRTGPACWLFYNEMTGRLEELKPELVDIYENGGNLAGHEFSTMGG